MQKYTVYKVFFKPLLDLVIALFSFILLFPIFILAAISLTLANKGNPFFTQKRPGKNTRIFTIIKFKTMNDKMDEKGNLLPDSERLTKVGSFFRNTSIDELPQLINVLKGDMSLIGPRPLLPEYLPFYTKSEKLRHAVRPGITGLAQISGRNSAPWDERFAYDIKYVKELSFRNDMRIFIKTFTEVLRSRGVSADPRSAMKDLHHER